MEPPSFNFVDPNLSDKRKGYGRETVWSLTSRMAWAMAKPNFFFQGLSNLPSSKTFIYQSLIFHRPLERPTFTSPVRYIHKPQIQHHFPLVSVDVSKEDKPLSNEPSSPTDPPGTEEKAVELKIDRLHLEERLAVLNTGIYECQSCGYLYNEVIGDPSYPIPPGFGFEKLPEDWRCSTCGAAKSFFESKSVEIAGFAQNQNFGFGTNTLTGGQKLLLIYGSLLLAFALFLSGYFLQ